MDENHDDRPVVVLGYFRDEDGTFKIDPTPLFHDESEHRTAQQMQDDEVNFVVFDPHDYARSKDEVRHNGSTLHGIFTEYLSKVFGPVFIEQYRIIYENCGVLNSPRKPGP